MSRPTLTPELAAAEFRSFYWLKEELVAFCRAQRLPTGGSKPALAQRIADYLATGKAPIAAARPPAASGAMPKVFTRQTVIGPGWRCSQELRAFFEREIGPRFHFDATLRAFVRHGQGKTLHEAILAWQNAQDAPIEREIAPQFEYNRHIRDYFKTHPGASLSEAIQAWKERRQHANPGSQENP